MNIKAYAVSDIQERLNQVNMSIICLENASTQGPEGRSKLKELEQERREILNKMEIQNDPS